MIDSHYRAPYQKWLLSPCVSLIESTSLSPNQLTILGALFGVATLPSLASSWNGAAAIFLLLSGFLDTLDGTLARRKGQTSPIGAAWDICSDRLVEFAVIFGLYLSAPHERAILCFLMLGSVLLCITSFLVVGIFVANSTYKSFHYSPGLMERTEAFLFFLAMMLLPSLFSFLALSFTALVTLTACWRLWQFSRHQSLEALSPQDPS